MKKNLLKKFLPFLVCVSLVAAKEKDKCFECHQSLGDKPSELFAHDVHFQNGISCAGCHGGNAHAEDMEQAMNTNAGFLGVPKGDAISEACAKCHSNEVMVSKYQSQLPRNQLEKLESSVHGKIATSGKEHIVQCITCHNSHGIVSVKNSASPVYPLNVVKTCTQCHADVAYMKTYNPSLAVDQLEKYRTSIHGEKNAKGDANVAECASCHGSHDIQNANDVRSRVYPTNLPQTCSTCHSNAEYMKEYNIPTNQFSEFAKSIHGVALLQKKDFGAPACNDCHGNHGATPPGISSISKVCGSCHALNAELFSESPHKKAYDERNFPECETCHGNHGVVDATDKLLGVNEGAVCIKCHQQDKFPKGYATAKTFRSLIDSLEYVLSEAIRLVEDAEQKGMEISEAKFKLREAHQARMESRTMIHSFNEEKFLEVSQRGFDVAEFVHSEAATAVDEFYYRRWGLGISTFIITIVAVSLFFYIRRIEKQQQTNETSLP